jgi:outer membrane protein OmpA-like peptidoglycan-associated protein
MNRSTVTKTHFGRALASTAMIALFLASCATTPQSPPGAADVRAKLTRLQSDTDLASRAPIEIREAETAVRLAETPVPKDQALGAYRVYLADYKVEIAEAKASTRYAEHQRIALSEAREQARLHARTLEADRAQGRADMARSDASRARSDATRARNEADAARASEADAAASAARRAELARDEAERARDATAAGAAHDAERARRASEDARALAAAGAAHDAERARRASEDARALAAADADREKAELQRQIDLLQARTTDRGLVLTLGNVLFATGRAELKAGSIDSLNNLVAFLNQYPDRNIMIEGHTDSVGTAASNLALSERRAGSVQSYLLQQGVGSQRITFSGMGESQPIADNDTDTGRQQNRRVEIIIDQPRQITAVTPSGQ